MSKKTKKVLLTALVLAVLLLVPVNVQAKPSAKTVKKLYNQYMAEHPSYTWFRMLDINQDGVKELITSTTRKDYRDYNQYYIYAVKSSKVTYVGKVVVSPAYGYSNPNKKELFYNKSLKAVGEFMTGSYSLNSTLYTMSGYKLKERLCMDATWGHYNIFGKRVYGGKMSYYKTEAAYMKHYDTYFKKGCKKYELVKNTAANRNKYLK